MLDIGGVSRISAQGPSETRAPRWPEKSSGPANPTKLTPMTPFERKVVHDAVAAAGLHSESEGEEPNRCVVVYPVD